MDSISEQFNYNVYLSLIAFILLIATMIAFYKQKNISKKIVNLVSYYFITLIIFNTIMSLVFQNIFYVKICILLSINLLLIKVIGFFFNNYFFYFEFKANKIKRNIKKIGIKKEIRKVNISFDKKENKIICNIYLKNTEYNQEKEYKIIELITKKNKLANDVNIFYL